MRIGPGTVVVVALALTAAWIIHGEDFNAGPADRSAQGRRSCKCRSHRRPRSHLPRRARRPPPPRHRLPRRRPIPRVEHRRSCLDDQEVSAILGKSVRSSAGEDMGRIVDVIVGHDGQIRAAIIDFGGFLGIGTRKIAVDWRALNFAPAGKPGTISLELTRNQVRLAPEYKRGEPVVVVGAAGMPRGVPASEAAAPER